MHPITACGIETRFEFKHPFHIPGCMHPITVYGIETMKTADVKAVRLRVACTLLPFTVLKPSEPSQSDQQTQLHAPYYRLRY
jgi:hypothetical protein